MTKLISAREYARRRGLSHTAVLKAIASKKIATHRGKIDPREADRALKSHQRTLAAVLTRKEEARARLLELELAQKEGCLVHIGDVEKEWAEVCGNIRSHLLQLPTKVAQRFGDKNQVLVRSFVEKEVRDVLTLIGNDQPPNQTEV